MFGSKVILFGILLHCVNSLPDYFFVVSPNVIRYEHEETVSVSIFGNQRNVQIEVWLEYRGVKFSNKTVTVSDERNPVQTSVSVWEENILISKLEEELKPRSLKLCAKTLTEKEDRCNELALSYNSGYIIIQTDKPIYSPNQKVSIRVLALNEDMIAINNRSMQISIDVLNPSSKTLVRRVIQMTSESGFYKHDFALPPYAEKGVWTAKAFYKGQYETVARTVFEVAEYVLPTFGVTIDVSETVILPDSNKTITVTVTAKYVYGKFVDGNVRLILKMTSDWDDKHIFGFRSQKLQSGQSSFTMTTGEILDSPRFRGRMFPTGRRLRVTAIVVESATGKEEAAYNDSTIFAEVPFVFKFSRTLKYFRPGIEYILKVDMTKVNGEPAQNENLTVQAFRGYEKTLLKEIRNVTTDSKGHAIAYMILEELSYIYVKVKASNEQTSDEFYLYPYRGGNQVLVEHKISGGTMEMSVFKKVQPNNTYTGMMFMIVARGKIVKATFKDANIMSSMEIDEHVQELINPSARLFVFYVDKNTSEVVADSIKFQLDGKCRGKKNLEVKPDQDLVSPGSDSDITISGEPFSQVGLNVIDKALLLLNKEGILHKNMMFQAMESHDIGCGPGSGESNGDVIRNAGLTLVTNALLNVYHMERKYCNRYKRRKRDTGCLYGADDNCCNYGIEYANTIHYETEADQRATIDTYATCYSMARNLTRDENIPTRCIMAYFHSCQSELEYLISEETQEIVSKSLDVTSKYVSDLELLNEHGITTIRTRDLFSESFLFEEVPLDSNGNAKVKAIYPDSITDWMIQAIGITQNKGVCIADPVDVRAFRDFFIQLDLPYKASRLEMFNVKVTIFNYGKSTDKPKKARIYMEGNDGLCYNSVAGIRSEPTQVELEPNSAKMVTFPVVPLKEGVFAVTVTAIVTELDIPQTDKIKKKLHVVNEGIPEMRTILVCLDPNNQTTDCDNSDEVKPSWDRGIQRLEIDLTLSGHIPGTGSATAYLYRGPFEGVVHGFVSGVEKVFTIPSGCMEQTISSFTPNIYAMLYLQSTGKITKAEVEKGTNNIRKGVVHMFSKSRSDGSYKSGTSHVWLTTFVAKIMCLSKQVVPDAVDQNIHLYPTIRWLIQRVSETDGRVSEFDNGNYYIMGQLNTTTPALTAFWLITMLECGVLQQEIDAPVKRAIAYLERQNKTYLQQEPYVLAITAYALALAKSDQLAKFASWLKEIKHQNERQIYLGNCCKGYNYWCSSWSFCAYNVETTAYALLAMLKIDDISTSESIVRWLTRRQDVHGAFYSTQDTIIGMQGLSEYNIRKHNPITDLKVRLFANNRPVQDILLTSQDYEYQRTVDKIPVETEDNKLIVTVEGTNGEGRMMIELRYNRPANKNEICPFNISDIEIGEVEDFVDNVDTDIPAQRGCDVCGQRCSGESPYANDSALTTPEPNNENQSKFGRRKRQAHSPQNVKRKCIRFVVSTKNNEVHGMSMVLFGLETGVSVVREDLEKLKEGNANLDQYELPEDGKSYIAFYLNELTSEANHFIFSIEDNFDGEVRSRQPATVTVFNYYKPEYKCLKMYGTGPDKEYSVGYSCTDTKKKNCQCIQNTCSQPLEDEIAKIDKPAFKLAKYTCTTEKANFAVLVKVISVNETDPATNEKRAKAELTRTVHAGTYPHLPGDELEFSWKAYCSHPTLQRGSSYYIVGKDDHFPYRLMDTALVIQLPEDTSGKREQYLAAVLRKYEQIMLLRGCVS